MQTSCKAHATPHACMLIKVRSSQTGLFNNSADTVAHSTDPPAAVKMFAYEESSIDRAERLKD